MSKTKAEAAASDFPIPNVLQQPYDDLCDALSLFSVLDLMIEDGMDHGMNKEAVADFFVAFCMARSNIRMVAAYLNADDRPGTLDIYRRVRREEIAQSFERGTS